jgi:hypothetical protein
MELPPLPALIANATKASVANFVVLSPVVCVVAVVPFGSAGVPDIGIYPVNSVLEIPWSASADPLSIRTFLQ